MHLSLIPQIGTLKSEPAPESVHVYFCSCVNGQLTQGCFLTILVIDIDCGVPKPPHLVKH